MRYRTTGLVLAVMALVVTSLPAAAVADPVVTGADPVVTGADPSVASANEKIVRCPKVTGKGKRKDCVMTADSAIRVVFGKGKGELRATEADARMVVRAAREGMGRYATFGFDVAEASARSPLVIVIRPDQGDPLYSWKSSVIYIGKGAADDLDAYDMAKAQSARMELWHEQFHWIQDEAYTMGGDRLIGSRTWWHETAAELMTFLIDPAGAARNATLYGSATIGSANASQFSPHQWPGDSLYQHAQRLLFSIYGPDRVMTPEAFVTAINEGAHPFADGDLAARFAAGLEGYAEYLLTGELPFFGIVEPIAAGTALGDYIGVIAERRKPAGEGLQLTANTGTPQIDVDARTVNAVMQADSVYALAVVSGPQLGPWEGARLAAEPAKLIVEPGPPFLLSIDGSGIAEHDGGSELVIEPIGEGGVGVIRIVAMAKAPAMFRARIEPIDLESGGNAELVHTVGNLDPEEQGSSELVCTYTGDAVLTMHDDWGEWTLVYEGENWHKPSGKQLVCGGGSGGQMLASGTFTRAPLEFTAADSGCDRDIFMFDGETMTGATYANCGDSDVYTYEVEVSPAEGGEAPAIP